MGIDNVLKDFSNKNIRVFTLQCRNPQFLLFGDLQFFYLLNLFIDTLSFSKYQLSLEVVYPFESYMNEFISKVDTFSEDIFIIYLENYYHSNIYALGFLELFLKILNDKKIKKNCIIYSHKTLFTTAKNLVDKYENIILFIQTDIEFFFFEYFKKRTSINDIKNIFYRDADNQIIFTGEEEVKYDLSSYICGAYYSKYFSEFIPSRIRIIKYLFQKNQSPLDNEYIDRITQTLDLQAMVSTGRGCRYSCSYCFRGAKYASVRQIPLDILEKDFQVLSEFGFKHISIYDDCFINTNYNRIDDIIALLSKYGFSYWIPVRYEVCSPSIMAKLSRLKITSLQIGLQSTDQNSNKLSKRSFHKERFENTFFSMKNFNIPVSLDLILGLPYEGLKGFLKTFQYALSLEPKNININPLFLNPYTELYENKEKYGIKIKKTGSIKDLFYVPYVYESNSFSAKDMEIARKFVLIQSQKYKHISITLR